MNPPSDESVPVVAKLEGVEAFGLQPEEAFIFSRVNGTSTLKEIAQMLGYDTARVWKSLERLVGAGFLKMDIRAVKAAPKKSVVRGKSILDQLDEDEEDPQLKKIPRERRSEILMRHAALAQQNHYEVLDLKTGASVESIRKNYFRLVKEYHPDRFFGQFLGHYKEKLEEIFGRITKSYEDLSDVARRKTYDHSLTKGTEGDKGHAPEATPSKITLTAKTLIERLALAKTYFERGKQAEGEGKDLSAASFYQMASQYDPNNQEFQKAYNRLKPLLLRKRADDLFSKGNECLARGDTVSATALFEEALTANPKKKECFRQLAMLYMHRKGSLERAKEMGLKAVECYPNDAAVRASMGKIFQGLGNFTLARKEYKLALKFDEDNEFALRGLSEIEGK